MHTVDGKIAAHDIFHALATKGVRPVPVEVGSEDVRSVPVFVVVHDNGQIVRLTPYRLVLAENVAKNAETGEPEQRAAVFLHVKLPHGALAAHKPPEATPTESADERVPGVTVAPDWTPGGLPDGRIPELEGLPKGVFETNPEAIATAFRDIRKKGLLGLDAGNKTE